MSKLFEVIGVKRTAHTTATEMVSNMMEAAYETLDELFPDGPEPENDLQNFECKVYHEDECAAVPARDFDICKCIQLRMEVHQISKTEAVVKVAAGVLLPSAIALKEEIDEEAN